MGNVFSPSLIVARLVNFQDGCLMAMWHHVLATWCRILHGVGGKKKRCNFPSQCLVNLGIHLNCGCLSCI